MVATANPKRRELPIEHRQIPPPLRLIGIRGEALLRSPNTVSVNLERLLAPIESRQLITELVDQNPSIGLPAGIPGMGVNPALDDRKAGAVARERLGIRAKRRLGIADLGMGCGKRALPDGIVGSDRGQPIADCKTRAVTFQGGGNVALRPEHGADSLVGDRKLIQ